MPTLMSLLPGSIVVLPDKGVNNNKMADRGWAIRFWPWDEIAYATAGSDTPGGTSYQVIILHGIDNIVLVTLALGAKTPLHEVQAYFTAHRKNLTTLQSGYAG